MDLEKFRRIRTAMPGKQLDLDLVDYGVIAEAEGISRQRVEQICKAAIFKCLCICKERGITFEDFLEK